MTDGGATFVLGVDFGSTTGKAVVLDGSGAVVGSAVSSEGAVSDEGVRTAMDRALAGAGITIGQVARAVSTGYGRRMLDVADRTITEITCHARGAVEMAPDARLVIDIGGQDSKVIAVDVNGLVEKFAMNDRCAAGTGKFLETLARALNVDLEAMGPMALEAREGVAITAMCATFAETEVIGLLAEGVAVIEILGAVHHAVAIRTAGLVSRLGLRQPVVMTGGVARNPAAVAYLERQLGCPLILPSEPQLAGALGAALFALDDFRQEGASPAMSRQAKSREQCRADDAVEADLEDAARALQDCAPACAAKTAETIRRR